MDSRITDLISAAEKHIESKEYIGALEQLSAAEHIEPNNKSVQMIRDLVKSLQSERVKLSPVKRFFSATVDPKSPTGFTREPAAPVSDLQKRIQKLTSSAEFFLSRGKIDNAFESLLRAYLLDPIAPEVIACEQRVLPAWQKLHGKTSTETKQEWTLSVASAQSKSTSSLFERLKNGKFLQ